MPKTKAKHIGHATAANRQPIKKDRLKPVADLLPVDVIEHMRNHLVEPLTAKRVREIAIEFDTENRFGVSPRRLGCFLRKLGTKTVQHPKSNEAKVEQSINQRPQQSNVLTMTDVSDDWPKRVQSHRRRQVTIASILDSTFGQLAENSPDLWAKRAYLMLVGVVYDRLVAAEKEIDTNELIKLAKVLAEGRKSVPQLKEANGPHTNTQKRRTLTNGALPAHLVDTVRQIYGVSFENTNATDGVSRDELSSDDSSCPKIPVE